MNIPWFYVLFNSWNMKKVRVFFWITDIGFIAYWAATLSQQLPTSYLYKDYDNPILMAWNLSFFPLDLLISFTGLMSLYLYSKKQAAWRNVALISLILTFCSGLQAIAFWVFRDDFDWMWWLPNLYLLLYPLFFIRPFLLQSLHRQAPIPNQNALIREI